MKLFSFFLQVFLGSAVLLFSAIVPTETDQVVFLFDHGEKNMVASMFSYAEKYDKTVLDRLDFRVVFMGTSVDAMKQEPFSKFSEKLVHYQELGIKEAIDRTWKRDGVLSQESLRALSENLIVTKKVWVSVSNRISEQLLEKYQQDPIIEVVALRDNPSADGDSDYFKMAQEVQCAANKIMVPSAVAANQPRLKDKNVMIIGHGPLEDFVKEAAQIDKTIVLKRLGLNPLLPVIVYTGSYGDKYQAAFEKFLALLPDEKIQVLVIPHPRDKGVVEAKLCGNVSQQMVDLRVINESEKDLSKKLTTIEGVAIADAVVTSDATSTIVFQANALGKKVFLINLSSSVTGEHLGDKKLVTRISSSEEFSKALKEISLNKTTSPNVFYLLGIPKNGAKLLWEEFIP